MIHLLELDLADAGSALPPVRGEAWILVRLGPEPLGEVRLELDPLWRVEVERSLSERFAPLLYGRATIRPEPAGDAGLPAGDVSVVICTRDRPRLLAGCLESLQRIDPPPGEVLVVDNAPSSAETADVASAHRVRYVVEPKVGLNRARNRGWETATGAVVAYVDDDARANRWLATALAQTFVAPEVGAVTGLVLPAELASYPQVAFERVEGGMGKGFERQVFHGKTAPVGLESFRLGVGTNMAFRREVLGAIGGFDERIGVGTVTRGACDLDALDRVLSAGYAIVYEPRALVRHIHRRDRRGLIGQMRDYGTSFAALLEARGRRAADGGAAVRRYRHRWHLSRHVVRPLKAIARREWLELQMAVAEARGSRRGVAALDAAVGTRRRSADQTDSLR
jgi:glycosyltransferase involved in cell wall biosynthesis